MVCQTIQPCLNWLRKRHLGSQESSSMMTTDEALFSQTMPETPTRSGWKRPFSPFFRSSHKYLCRRGEPMKRENLSWPYWFSQPWFFLINTFFRFFHRSDGFQRNCPSPLPKLLDFGRGKCIPCKKMAPVSSRIVGRVIMIVSLLKIFGDWSRTRLPQTNPDSLIPTQIYFSIQRIRKFSDMKDFMSKRWHQESIQKMGIQ